MANPRVSPANWERLRALAQIDIGTDRVEAEQMGFTKQLEVVVADPESENSYRDEINKFKFGGKSPEGLTHADWEEGVTVEIDPNHQRRPHRPYVPDDVVDKLKSAVKVEYPNVPVESYSFDDILGLYLDRKEAYLEYLGCRVEGENYKDGEQTEAQ